MAFLRRQLSRQPKGPRLYWLTADIAIAKEPADEEWAAIRAAGIRSVLDLRAEQADNSTIVGGHELRYLRLPVQDGSAPTGQQLSLITDWILERISTDGPV